MPLPYIPVDKQAIPYEVTVKIADETFTFRFDYNRESDFFTVDLRRGEEVLVIADKIVYGHPLFSSYADDRFPKMAIFPGDLSGQAGEVNFANLMESVFLYVVSEADLIDLV